MPLRVQHKLGFEFMIASRRRSRLLGELKLQTLWNSALSSLEPTATITSTFEADFACFVSRRCKPHLKAIIYLPLQPQLPNG